jgi:replicative DNA helicase
MTDNSPIPLPYSREAEEAVIGAVLINPEAYHEVAAFLRAEDFFIHRHRFIWEAIIRLHERRSPVDFLTISTELERMGRLAEVGGPAYLTSLINFTPTSLHAEAYSHIIEQAAIRRRLLEAAHQVVKLAYQEDAALDTRISTLSFPSLLEILSYQSQNRLRHRLPRSRVRNARDLFRHLHCLRG